MGWGDLKKKTAIMSLQTKLMLVLLMWFCGEVAPRSSRRFRYNGTARNTLRHLANYSMHDSRSTSNGVDQPQSDVTLWGEQNTDGLVKQLKGSVKPKGLKMHRDGELERADLAFSLSCSDLQTRLSLSDGRQSPGTYQQRPAR